MPPKYVNIKSFFSLKKIRGLCGKLHQWEFFLLCTWFGSTKLWRIIGLWIRLGVSISIFCFLEKFDSRSMFLLQVVEPTLKWSTAVYVHISLLILTLGCIQNARWCNKSNQKLFPRVGLSYKCGPVSLNLSRSLQASFILLFRSLKTFSLSTNHSAAPIMWWCCNTNFSLLKKL